MVANTDSTITNRRRARNFESYKHLRTKTKAHGWLTDDERTKAEAIRAAAVDLSLSTDRVDRERATAAVKDLYTRRGFPNPVVVHADGVLTGAIVGALLHGLETLSKSEYGVRGLQLDLKELMATHSVMGLEYHAAPSVAIDEEVPQGFVRSVKNLARKPARESRALDGYGFTFSQAIEDFVASLPEKLGTKEQVDASEFARQLREHLRQPGVSTKIVTTMTHAVQKILNRAFPEKHPGKTLPLDRPIDRSAHKTIDRLTLTAAGQVRRATGKPHSDYPDRIWADGQFIARHLDTPELADSISKHEGILTAQVAAALERLGDPGKPDIFANVFRLLEEGIQRLRLNFSLSDNKLPTDLAMKDVYAYLRSCLGQWEAVLQLGNMGVSWDSFFQIMRDAVGLELPIWKDFRVWEEANRATGARFVYPTFCIVCDRPAKIRTDQHMRPHCEDGPAYRWRDGWNQYFIHGLPVSEKTVLAPQTLTVDDILDEENLEVRRIMLERMGWERFCKVAEVKVLHRDELRTNFPTIPVSEKIDAGARLVTTYRAGTELAELLQVKGVTDFQGRALKFVHLADPSTGREYVLRVNRKHKRCYQAVGSTFGMTEEQYKDSAYLRQGDVLLRPLTSNTLAIQQHS